jgi:hypothetical protein
VLAAPRNAWTLSGKKGAGARTQRSGPQKAASGAASEGQTHASEAKAIRAAKKPAGLLDGSLADIIGNPAHGRAILQLGA